MSTLYIVATPIGNLDDITFRAINVLKSVPIIVSEDTRHTRVLLSHYGIENKRLISFDAHKEIEGAKGIVKLLQEGNDVALTTDAGTPCISDPGARLTEEARDNDITIIPLPGASAVTTLLSASGNIGKAWTFEGFLPRTDGKIKKRLIALLERNEAFVLYESPYRIVKLLEILNNIDKNRVAVIGRELTKIHEEIVKGTIEELYNNFKNRQSIKGEFVLIITSMSRESKGYCVRDYLIPNL